MAKLTDEIKQKLNDGSITFESIADDADLMKEVDAWLDETPPAEATDEEEPAASEAPPAPPEPEPGVTAPEAPQPSDAERELAEARQRQRELEALKPKPVETPADAKPVEKADVWTDEHQLSAAEELKKLRQEFDEYKRVHSTVSEREFSKVREMQDNADFQVLQQQFPEFKTAEKLSAMEKRYAEFFYGIGATAEDPSPVTKYFADPAFRAQQEAKGLKFDKADFDRVNTVLSLKQKRDALQKADPDATLADAHLLHLRRTNKLQAVLARERQAGAAEIADTIHRNMNGVTPAPAGAPSGGADGGMTEAQMLAWMDAHPNPRTKDEKATFARIEAYLDKNAKVTG